MLIVEEMFLLMRRDDGKAESDMARRFYGLLAAVLTDLALAQRISLSDDADPRVTVLVPAPVGHPALDAAIARLQRREGAKLSTLMVDGKLAVEEPVARALAAAGVVDVEEKRALGLAPARYPVRDPEPERRARERLRTVLMGGTASPADSAVLAILQGLGIAHTVLADEMGTLTRAQLKARIEEVATDVKAGTAVRKAIEAMNVAIMAAVVVPVVVTGT